MVSQNQSRNKRIKKVFPAIPIPEIASQESQASQEEFLQSVLEGVRRVASKYNSPRSALQRSKTFDVKPHEKSSEEEINRGKAEANKAGDTPVNRGALPISSKPCNVKDGPHCIEENELGIPTKIHEVNNHVINEHRLVHEDHGTSAQQKNLRDFSQLDAAHLQPKISRSPPAGHARNQLSTSEVLDWSVEVSDIENTLHALELGSSDAKNGKEAGVCVIEKPADASEPALEALNRGNMNHDKFGQHIKNVVKRKRSETTMHRIPHRRAAKRSMNSKDDIESSSNGRSFQRSSSQGKGPASSRASETSQVSGKRAVRNFWSSSMPPWNKEKEESSALQVTSLALERGPAPGRFSKPIEDVALQRLINGVPRLPELQAQLEAYLPSWLQRIPNPILLSQRQKSYEKSNADFLTKHGVQPKELLSGAMGAKKCNPITQKPNSRLILGNLDREGLLALQAIGDKARAARRGGSRGSLIINHEKRLMQRTKQKVGCENPPTRLTHLQRKSVELLVHTSPDLPIEIATYEREDHGGAPTQVSGVWTIDKDNLSELSEPPKQETVQSIHRWRWFIAIEESLATAESDEHSIDSLHCQLVEWDGEYDGPSIDLDVMAKIDLPESKYEWFNTWMQAVTHNAMKRPFSVDITTEEFKSGRGHVTGLRREYIEFPPDSLFKFTAPQFGPIEWGNIEIISPSDPFSQSPLRRKQSALICSEIATAEWREFDKEAKAKKELAEKAASRKIKLMRDGQVASPVYRHPNKAETKDNAWVPSANIYIRPAQKGDMEQVFGLYNHYIVNSVQALELRQLNEADWLDIFEKAAEEKFPFLVAVQKTRKARGWAEPDPWGQNVQRPRGRKGPQPSPRREKILGFVYCECFGFTGSSLEDAVEVQVWVDSEHQRCGIGKNLLDRFLPSVDSMYYSHRGTDFIPPPGEDTYYSEGGRRPAKKILVNILYDGSKPDEYKWKKEYLESKWAFHQTGFYLNIAEKFGRPINLASFMRECQNMGGEMSCIWPGQPLAVPGLIEYI